MKGKFLLTYDDHPDVVKALKDFEQVRVKAMYSINNKALQAGEKVRQGKQLMIANYPLKAALKDADDIVSLSDFWPTVMTGLGLGIGLRTIGYAWDFAFKRGQVSKKAVTQGGAEDSSLAGLEAKRVRFNRGSLDTAIEAAKRLQADHRLYIFSTVYGFTIEHHPPSFGQQYVYVDPDGSVDFVESRIAGRAVKEGNMKDATLAMRFVNETKLISTTTGDVVVRKCPILGTNHLTFDAWEHTKDEHSAITYFKGEGWRGRVGTKRLPKHLEALSAYSQDRLRKVKAWQEQEYNRAYRYIEKAFPEIKGEGRRSLGQIDLEVEAMKDSNSSGIMGQAGQNKPLNFNPVALFKVAEASMGKDVSLKTVITEIRGLLNAIEATDYSSVRWERISQHFKDIVSAAHKARGAIIRGDLSEADAELGFMAEFRVRAIQRDGKMRVQMIKEADGEKVVAESPWLPETMAYHRIFDITETAILLTKSGQYDPMADVADLGAGQLTKVEKVFKREWKQFITNPISVDQLRNLWETWKLPPAALPPSIYVKSLQMQILPRKLMASRIAEALEEDMGISVSQTKAREMMKEYAIPEGLADSGADHEAEAGLVLSTETPAYIDVWKNTITKHYRLSSTMHKGSVRTVKSPGVLVILGCPKSAEWKGGVCSENQEVVQTHVTKTPGAMKEVEDWEKAGVTVSYKAKKEGITPRDSIDPVPGQDLIKELSHAIEKSEVIA